MKLSAPGHLILGLRFIFIFGCAPVLVFPDGEINSAKVREIQKRLVEIRKLEFRREVPIEVKTVKGIHKDLETELLQDYGEEKLIHKALAYGRLGLLPAGIDLRRSLAEFYGSQVAAYYSPKTKAIVFPLEGAGSLHGVSRPAAPFQSARAELILAHELAHAIQDQHFDLEAKLEPSDNDDRVLALRSVAEGDAILSGFSALLGWTDMEFLSEVKTAMASQWDETRSSLAHFPEALVEEMLFQYSAGLPFVYRVLNERGWLGVERVYVFPPLSTEQVLYWEKYIDAPDPPTRISTGDLGTLFPPEWREIENNNLGELMICVLFRKYFSEEEAREAARGWDGDRLVAFRRADEISYIWFTVWDSTADAEEFRVKYRKLRAKRNLVQENDGKVYIERRGDKVIVVEGLDEVFVGNRIDGIWKELELEEEPFQRPFPPLRKEP